MYPLQLAFETATFTEGSASIACRVAPGARPVRSKGLDVHAVQAVVHVVQVKLLLAFLAAFLAQPRM